MTEQKLQGQVKERRFSWQFLFLGILDIFIALLAFRDPQATLGSVVYFFGFTAIFQGLTVLFMANTVSRYFGIKNIWINIRHKVHKRMSSKRKAKNPSDTS